MKIKQLVGSFLIYEFSLPHVKKAQPIALKAAKGKNSYGEESDDGCHFDDEFFMYCMELGKLLKKIP